MSSGTKGDISLFSQAFSGFADYRTWSGDDGRTEATSTGKLRSKWNNFTMTRAYRRRTSNKWTATLADGSTAPINADVTMTANTAESSLTALDFQAQSRLANAVRGHSFNLAVNVAQSRQLVDMVVSNLGKLGRSILALKRGDFATAARQLGARPRASRLVPSDVSGRWLELQYGWLPALSDTFEAAKAYEELTKDNRKTTIRASAKDSEVFNTVVGGIAASEMRQIRRVIYTYELSEQLSTQRSLGLADPLSVIWEIIPYSFVVDWFIPIGTYLDTLSILPTLQGRWMKTIVREHLAFESLKWTQDMPAFIGGIGLCTKVEYLGSDVGRALYVQRLVGSGSLPVALPNFNANGLHGTRIWNAIALAAQRFL